MKRAWRRYLSWPWLLGAFGGIGTVAGAFASVLQIIPSPADLRPVLWGGLKAFANEQVLAATAAFEKKFTVLEDHLADVDDHLLALDVSRLEGQLAALRANRPQLDELLAKNPDSGLLRIQIDELAASIAKLAGQLTKAQCALDKRTTSPWLVC